jgi:hypothetical protein
MKVTTHNKKSGLSKRTAKRLTSKTTKLPPAISKPVAARNGTAQNGNDLLEHVDKANAHLMKALEMIRKSRSRKASKTSQKWRKSLTTRTS